MKCLEFVVICCGFEWCSSVYIGMDIGVYFGINVEFLGLFDEILDFSGFDGILGVFLVVFG